MPKEQLAGGSWGSDLIGVTAGRRPGPVSRLLGPRLIGAADRAVIGAGAATSQLFEPSAQSLP